MSRLTNRRLEKGGAILERYRAQLYARGSFNALAFEHDLRGCWNLGYRGLKGIMQDLLTRPRYRYLAAYYMERSNATGVVCEFQQPLANEYGIEWYHADDREEKRRAYWERFEGEAAAERRNTVSGGDGGP
jgi:hypothetical protein